jgi:HPt (histidine-containing phosphotransfer) domain-containing protein
MTDLSLAQPADSPKLESIKDIAPSLVNIRKRFCEMAVDRILAFESMKMAIAANRQPEQALAEIANLAHKITGVAATLGYPQTGQLAADVELTVRAGVSSRAPSHQTWISVEPILEALLDELESLLS